MSRPTTTEVDDALCMEAPSGGSRVNTLSREVTALRHDLEYERTLRNGLERMLKDLGTQLTAADEVLP